MKTEDRKKLGKKSRKQGQDFERKVREDLESKGWIVLRWDKNIEFPIGYEGVMLRGEFVQTTGHWNNFLKRIVVSQSGFPDFVCIKLGVFKTPVGDIRLTPDAFEVQFVECKTNGILDKLEREKSRWIKEKLHIPIFIASKQKIKRKIEVHYESFGEKDKSA